MKEHITLSPFMRGLLLREICRRMDIIEYCQHQFHMSLTKNIRDTYTGDCPWCEGHESFVINEVTGQSYCMGCGKEADFFSLLQAKHNDSLTTILSRLTGCVQAEDERRRKIYERCAS
jgi:DNA primase